MELLGRVHKHPKRGWCIEFRTVRWPGRDKPRRVYVTQAPDYGRFTSEAEANKTNLRIQARLIDGRPLHEVLSRYIEDVPEDRVLHRWRAEWLPELRRRHARARLSADRLRHFERYEGRGYLGFWAEVSIHAVDRGKLRRWLSWLEEHKPHLSPSSLKHLMADFGTFLRWIDPDGQCPALPRIEVPVYHPKVPEAGDVARILAKIPEQIRGLWLARCLAGLRPSEARRLEVSDYRAGVILIPSVKSKTKRPRALDVENVVPELDAWIRAHRDGAWGTEPLFPNQRGKWWKETPERRVWSKALEAARLEHVKPNEGGRHAFATHEIAIGTDPYAVKDWLGHTTLATTERYKTVTAVTLARRMRPASGTPAESDPKKEAK